MVVKAKSLPTKVKPPIVKARKAAASAALRLIKPKAPADTKPRKLTEKEEILIECMGAGESASAAAFRAGYRDNGGYAYQFAKRPWVQDLIARAAAKNEAANDMTRKKFMDMLMDAFATAKLVAEPASMVSAAREIGRACGYYEPRKTELTITTEGNVVREKITSLTDKQLLDLINGPAPDTPQLPLAERAD